ncbi:MAG: hypothetical protein ACRBF0_16335 [Calditrichia bacterium]
MKQLDEQAIIAAWEEVTELLVSEDENQLNSLIKDFETVQPNILAYTFAAGGDMLDEDEHANQFFYGTIIWKAIGDETKIVSEDALVEQEELIFRDYERAIKEGQDSLEEIAEVLREKTEQTELISSLYDDILEELPDDADDDRLNAAAWMMIHLCTVSTCLEKNVM